MDVLLHNQYLIVSGAVFFFRCFKCTEESFIKVPVFGAVSYLTLAISPFCITFAVVWAVYRNSSFGWIGQDILVRIISFCSLTYLYGSFHFVSFYSNIYIFFLFLNTSLFDIPVFHITGNCTKFPHLFDLIPSRQRATRVYLIIHLFTCIGFVYFTV